MIFTVSIKSSYPTMNTDQETSETVYEAYMTSDKSQSYRLWLCCSTSRYLQAGVAEFFNKRKMSTGKLPSFVAMCEYNFESGTWHVQLYPNKTSPDMSKLQLCRLFQAKELKDGSRKFVIPNGFSIDGIFTFTE